ncbi:3',5'-cyclic-nucleotide phosphodiesterase [Methylobacterium iners]|uniref:3',5'-cyclic-nucleotide phosphodiesterase n=1 Tax=Methylobacterium iners TaxID=418707 RepID=A0ABQ4RWL3_9HYPH|nr:3',5'-cyclic-nucleotide phosphodiesterase [Methylobacterium iners]GJD95241.1 hypothetical protein OCOJLMKI_2452 [Methylobacterium iners]
MALKLTSLAVVACALVAGSAVAQTAPQTRRGNETLKKYCTGDYLTYCGDLAPSDPAVDKCFGANWAKLNENCRRAIDAYEKTTAGKKG